jgi:hypothetical protein
MQVIIIHARNLMRNAGVAFAEPQLRLNRTTFSAVGIGNHSDIRKYSLRPKNQTLAYIPLISIKSLLKFPRNTSLGLAH